MKNKFERVVCLVDYYDAGLFFLRLAATDQTREYVIITNLASIWIRSQKQKIKCRLITKTLNKTPFTLTNSELESTREFRLKILTDSECIFFFNACMRELNTTHSKGLSRIYCWNGNSIMGEATRQYASKHNIKTLFFEIANIPGKMFVDWKGTNAQSYLYQDPSIVDVAITDDEVNQTLKEIIKLKDKDRTTPQSSLSQKIRFHHAIDYIYCTFFGIKTHTSSSIRKKLRINKKSNNNCPISYASDEVLGEYIFFPMQVSNDTQLLLNSEYSNIGALEHIITNYDLPVIVKPHPADQHSVNEIINSGILKRGKIQFSNNDTLELIKKSTIVITINSTVGFESLLLNKNTIFLGRSFYASMSKKNIANYYKNYLIDANFFAEDTAPISLKALEQINKHSMQSIQNNNK